MSCVMVEVDTVGGVNAGVDGDGVLGAEVPDCLVVISETSESPSVFHTKLNLICCLSLTNLL